MKSGKEARKPSTAHGFQGPVDESVQAFLKARKAPTEPPVVDPETVKDFKRAAPYLALMALAGISYLALNWGPREPAATPSSWSLPSSSAQRTIASQETEFSSFDACFLAAKAVVEATKTPGRRVVEPLFQPGHYYSAIVYTDDGKRVVIGCDGRMMRAKDEPAS